MAGCLSLKEYRFGDPLRQPLGHLKGDEVAPLVMDRSVEDRGIAALAIGSQAMEQNKTLLSLGNPFLDPGQNRRQCHLGLPEHKTIDKGGQGFGVDKGGNPACYHQGSTG